MFIRNRMLMKKYKWEQRTAYEHQNFNNYKCPLLTMQW